MKLFELNNNQKIPALGFGTWQITGDSCTRAVETALEVGYRHIDTAFAYGNHKDIKKALNQSRLKREELFITSKLWRDNYHRADAIDAGRRALDELGVEYLDLFLIHWPDRNTPIMETLDGLFELKNLGIIKEWGVSNFTIHHLTDVIHRGVKIANNQVEIHPSLTQPKLREFCRQQDILITAYSPIAQGYDLKLPKIQEIAEKYERTPSQVILNWIMQSGMVAIPKATSLEHIEDNFKSTEWELDQKDIEEINKLDEDHRIVFPDFNEFDY